MIVPITFVDGWRGKIGLITPAPGSATESEFHQFKPKGVAVQTTRIPLFDNSREGMKQMTAYVGDAAMMMAQSGQVDFLLFSCTAGSFVDGEGYDKTIVSHLEQITGLPVTSTSTCVLEAIEALGIKSMAIVTPYSEEINKLEKAFFEENGIHVTSISGSLLSDSRDVPRIPAGEMFKYAKAADCPEADAIFISCTGLHVTEIIEPLERDLGKPVLTSNQCGLWGTFRKISIRDHLQGLGMLFSL